MNMQNKLRTWNVQILQNSQNSQKNLCTHGKVGTPRQEKDSDSQKSRLKKRPPAPWPTPIHNLSMMSMVWNLSTGQLGLAAWLRSLPAPAHLLVSWTWETEKKSPIS